MKKRGQVTIFIIIAIILIAAVGLYFTFRETFKINTYEPHVENVKLFVEECIKDTGEDAIYYIGQNGGYFLLPELSTYSGIPYYYYNERNYMPSKERVAMEVSEYINEMLFFCTRDFVDFIGLEIKQGNVTTKTIIEDEEVIFNIDYPLAITKANSTSRLKDFENIKVFTRVGVIYNAISEIIQDQLTHENICLSCMINIVEENDLTIDMINTEEGLIFSVRDENYEIPLEFKFANKYG